MPKISNPTKTAVLFIECQNGILGPDSVLPAIRDAALSSVPAMARLAAGARAAGVTVAHLTAVPVRGSDSFNRRTPLFRGFMDHIAHWGSGHPAVQPIDEIGVGPDDLVLPRATGISPTYGNETFKLLRNIGIDTVVFAGISVNIAITVSAAQAADEDFRVVIARDAAAGAPEEYAAAMMQHTLAMIARLHTVDELLADWDAS